MKKNDSICITSKKIRIHFLNKFIPLFTFSLTFKSFRLLSEQIMDSNKTLGRSFNNWRSFSGTSLIQHLHCTCCTSVVSLMYRESMVFCTQFSFTLQVCLNHRSFRSCQCIFTTSTELDHNSYCFYNKVTVSMFKCCKQNLRNILNEDTLLLFLQY